MLKMRWEDLLFLHWAVAPEIIRPHLPQSLELDTYDGQAWLGVVPFTMASTRFRCLPPMPTAHRFPECNLRTYVRCGDHAGVWFFSLDAGSRLAVEGARLGFGLPYFAADMQSVRVGDQVKHRSRRRDRRGPPAEFEASWSPVGEWREADPATLEHFLVERYSLFSLRRGRLLRGDVTHPRWQLSEARAEVTACDMTRLLGLHLNGEPALVLAARPLEVHALRPYSVII